MKPAFLSSQKQDWETPHELFHELDDEFHFTLDVAASELNAKSPRYFTEANDGLKQDWSKDVCWCNPPYGGQQVAWLRKAHAEAQKGATVVCLVACRPETKWWQEYAPKATEIRQLGRLKFVGAKHQAPFLSALLIFRPPASPAPLQRNRRKAIVGQGPAPKAHKYQFLPELTDDEYQALMASIAERGVDVPILVDQDGEIIDGFNRQRACDELKVHCPKEVREFASEAERYETALQLNCRRRQLTRRQKKELVAAYLKRDPAMADNHLAEIIGGVSKNTVSEVRQRLERTRQIDKLKTLRGKDGKERPKKYKRIIANTAKEAETAFGLITALPERCEGKTLDIVTARRRAARSRNQRVWNGRGRTLPSLAGDDIRLFHCRFQDLAKTAGIAPDSVKLIFTDIPYSREFAESGEVEDLAAFAKQILVPGGVFITYSGKYSVNAILPQFERHLTYRWIGASVWKGHGSYLAHLGVASHWKSLPIFSKGNWIRPPRWTDVSWIEGEEKNWHEWQQPLEEAEQWIAKFSVAGDLVVDPCGGSFTTAAACRHLGRKFIGCDIDAKCVEVGQKRLAQEIQRKEASAQSIAHSV